MNAVADAIAVGGMMEAGEVSSATRSKKTFCLMIQNVVSTALVRVVNLNDYCLYLLPFNVFQLVTSCVLQ